MKAEILCILAALAAALAPALLLVAAIRLLPAPPVGASTPVLGFAR